MQAEKTLPKLSTLEYIKFQPFKILQTYFANVSLTFSDTVNFPKLGQGSWMGQAYKIFSNYIIPTINYM